MREARIQPITPHLIAEHVQCGDGSAVDRWCWSTASSASAEYNIGVLFADSFDFGRYKESCIADCWILLARKRFGECCTGPTKSRRPLLASMHQALYSGVRHRMRRSHGTVDRRAIFLLEDASSRLRSVQSMSVIKEKGGRDAMRSESPTKHKPQARTTHVRRNAFYRQHRYSNILIR